MRRWLSMQMFVAAALVVACGSDDSDSPDAGVDAAQEPDTGPDNQDPVIESLTADQQSVSAGDLVTVTLVANDPDGDTLEIAWSASAGVLDAETGPGPVVWTAPSEPGTHVITVTVTDGQGGSAEQSVDVSVLGWVLATGTDDLPAGKPLKNVAFLSPEEGWAVGGDEVDNVPYLFHLTGGAWVDETPGNFGHMHGFAVLGADDAWMIGGEGMGFHMDGEGWDALQVPGGCVHGLDFLTADDGWITPAHGQVGMRHYTGGGYTDWIEVPTPANSGLEGVSMISADDGFAVGAGGMIIRYDGTEWTEVDTLNRELLHDVEMIDATDGWAVGDEGVLLRFDGEEWDDASSPVRDNLYAAHALATDQVWVVGERGTILFYDGAAWTRMETPTEADLYGVFALSPTNVWAVGSDTTILHLE